MTPKLVSKLDSIISNELMLAMIELNEMNESHLSGLQGYKRFHRFFACDRQRHAVMLSNYVVEFHHITPNISVNYTSINSKSTSLLASLNSIHSSSQTHIALLKETARIAIDECEDLLTTMLEKMIADESRELELYYREISELVNTNSDKVFIQLHSDKLHDKYKSKEIEYFGYDDKKYGGV
jgi:ferritin